jgi:hypothetical protein
LQGLGGRVLGFLTLRGQLSRIATAATTIARMPTTIAALNQFVRTGCRV